MGTSKFYFNGNRFHGGVSSAEDLGRLQTTYPDYREARRSDENEDGMPCFGFYHGFTGESLSSWMSRHWYA